MKNLISDVLGWVQGKKRLGAEPVWFQDGETYLKRKECFPCSILWIWRGTKPVLEAGHEWLLCSCVMPSQNSWVPWKCTQATGGILSNSIWKDQEAGGSQVLTALLGLNDSIYYTICFLNAVGLRGFASICLKKSFQVSDWWYGVFPIASLHAHAVFAFFNAVS